MNKNLLMQRAKSLIRRMGWIQSHEEEVSEVVVMTRGLSA